MASFGPTGLPNSEHAHRINRGTLTFSYTCAGLTGTALLFVILFFCYKSRNRAPVAAAVAAAAETGTEGRRCVDLSKLPEYAYTLSARHGGSGDGAQCSVCLGTLQAGEMMRMLPLCNHLYHVECIDIWLVSHDTCPLCRSEVEPPEEDGKPATTTELPV